MITNRLGKFRVFVFLVLINFSALAEDGDGEKAVDLIRTTSEQIISKVKEDRQSLKSDPGQIHTLVKNTIVPHVDFTRMSRWVLGKNWRRASKPQQQQFVDEFRKMLIRTYSSALLKFSDEEMVFLPLKEPIKKGKLTVKSEIRTPDGQRFRVDYRMHNRDIDWKVYDISVDGVSLVSTYRASFSAEIREAGMDGLLASMVEKNKGLDAQGN